MSDTLKIEGRLLPCPFCGGEVRLVEGEESAYVQCLSMKMHRALWFDGDNDAAAEVREQWNRRDTSIGDEAFGLLERAAELVPATYVNWHASASATLTAIRESLKGGAA